jgi:hypothetical protein
MPQGSPVLHPDGFMISVEGLVQTLVKAVQAMRQQAGLRIDKVTL